MAANIGLPPSEAQTWQWRVSYDLNNLQTLKTGRETLDDDARTRRTHSALLELGYSFNQRFSTDLFLAAVRQERVINQFGNTDQTVTNGIGDGVLLAKYRWLMPEHERQGATVGLGIKAPIGTTDRTGSSGLPVIADLQPGSGAWDVLLWHQFVAVAKERPTTSFAVTAIYAIKGKNRDYLGSEIYQFGNELQLAVGLSDRLFWLKSIFDPSLELRYRHVAVDEQNGQVLPSTGGQWLFLTPGISWWLQPTTSLNVSLALPVFADIEGTQLSPTSRFTIGFFQRFQAKNNTTTSK